MAVFGRHVLPFELVGTHFEDLKYKSTLSHLMLARGLGMNPLWFLRLISENTHTLYCCLACKLSPQGMRKDSWTM